MPLVLSNVEQVSSLILIFSLLFLVQRYTIGLFPFFKQRTVFKRFEFGEILFLLSSAVLMVAFVRV